MLIFLLLERVFPDKEMVTDDSSMILHMILNYEIMNEKTYHDTDYKVCQVAKSAIVLHNKHFSVNKTTNRSELQLSV